VSIHAQNAGSKQPAAGANCRQKRRGDRRSAQNWRLAPSFQH
jgi:hypothetical protein